tara:strand:- start:800 stop:976 length:177 start_codon:yes stop_codon:yes gene_type:complete
MMELLMIGAGGLMMLGCVAHGIVAVIAYAESSSWIPVGLATFGFMLTAISIIMMGLAL